MKTIIVLIFAISFSTSNAGNDKAEIEINEWLKDPEIEMLKYGTPLSVEDPLIYRRIEEYRAKSKGYVEYILSRLENKSDPPSYRRALIWMLVPPFQTRGHATEEQYDRASNIVKMEILAQQSDYDKAVLLRFFTHFSRPSDIEFLKRLIDSPVGQGVQETALRTMVQSALSRLGALEEDEGPGPANGSQPNRDSTQNTPIRSGASVRASLDSQAPDDSDNGTLRALIANAMACILIFIGYRALNRSKMDDKNSK